VPAAAAILAGVVWTSLPRERVADLTRPAKMEGPVATPTGGETTTAAPAPPPDRAAGEAVTRPPAAPAPSTLQTPAAAKPAAPQAARPAAAETKTKEALDTAAAPRLMAEATTPPPAPVADAAKRADAASPQRSVATDRREALAPLAKAAPASAAGDARPAGTTGASNVTAARPQQRAERQGDAAAPSAGAPVVTAADPMVAWRVQGTSLERTLDGGVTWQDERAPDVTLPLVGSAPSADVCWIASGNGLLLRRGADGRWTRVTPPAGDAIVRIEARSALAATLVMAGGLRVATTDAGATWSEVR
jgi:hypothetical protein